MKDELNNDLTSTDKLLDFYPVDNDDLKHILRALSLMPGIVNVNQIESLKEAIALATQNEGLFLQLGNCAEGFSDVSYDYVRRQASLVLAMKDLLQHGLNLPITPVARLAGQFGKPRSCRYENDSSRNLLKYHGDLINSLSESERDPNPYNLLIAYAWSKKLYKYLQQCQACVDNQIYISHEAFLLVYEEAFTHNFNGHYYNMSSHFLWIGYRSIYRSSPHIDYAKKISNPVGIKVGAKISPLLLGNLVQTINPKNEFGKIVLILRLGKDSINSLLPEYIKEIKKNRFQVLWVCDPMHGNTKVINGRKIRFLEDIFYEMGSAITIFKKFGIKTIGIHLEAIEEDILECVDSQLEVDELLVAPYKSLMDPRLNG